MRGNSASKAAAANPASAAGERPVTAQRILVVDNDTALFDLLKEWLTTCGHDVLRQADHDGETAQRVDLIIADIPFPRQGIKDAIGRLSTAYPGTPIIALSSTFFSGVESHGAIARALGVSAVTAKPLQRDAFVALVTSQLRGQA